MPRALPSGQRSWLPRRRAQVRYLVGARHFLSTHLASGSRKFEKLLVWNVRRPNILVRMFAKPVILQKARRMALGESVLRQRLILPLRRIAARLRRRLLFFILAQVRLY